MELFIMLNNFFELSKSPTLKIASKLIPKKLAISSALMLGVLLSQLPISGASASRNYQERDGIFGEIKYVRFCNHASVMQIRVIAEAGSRSNCVRRVEFKMKSSYVTGYNVKSVPLAYTTNYNWRSLGASKYNSRSGDRRWYKQRGYWLLTSSANNAPVQFAIHVIHTGGRTIDLGGIVNLGSVPVGQCRTYDDGTLRNY